MFGFIPDMLLIIVGAGVVLLVWRTVERRKAKSAAPADIADKFS